MTAENPRHLPPEALDGWLEEISGLLEIDQQIDVGLLLDLTRDVAHDVARPAAPLTTFVLGLALGRLPEDQYESEFRRLCAELTRLASNDSKP